MSTLAVVVAIASVAAAVGTVVTAAARVIGAQRDLSASASQLHRYGCDGYGLGRYNEYIVAVLSFDVARIVNMIPGYGPYYKFAADKLTFVWGKV